ncbi:hypothetical protein ACHAWF_006939 [Thalassiosira exigua]
MAMAMAKSEMPTPTMTTCNGAARVPPSDGDRLADYLLRESRRPGGAEEVSAEEVRRRALERLVEDRMGGELTAAVRGRGEGALEEAAEELAGTPAFRSLRDDAEGCARRLREASSSSSPPAVEDEGEGEGSATPEPPLKKKPAPTSFSLFDLLDSRGGGFALPPRVTAEKILEARRREKSDAGGDGGGGESALELLEKADDAEDLSPDPESWDEVRAILYEGLTSSASPSSSGSDERARYLTVHASLFERCLKNPVCAPQSWGLAADAIGAALRLSARLVDGVDSPSDPKVAEFCWDLLRSVLDELSLLATDHAKSCVGNEREVDRVLLGLCLLLSDDFLSSVLGMAEPYAGTFEVWSRLVDPARFVVIVRASGLGEAASRRSRLPRGAPSGETAWEMARCVADVESRPSLDDVEHCAFLQSLSISRTVLFRCGGSPEAVRLLSVRGAKVPDQRKKTLSPFLSSRGVVDPDAVEAILKAEGERGLCGEWGPCSAGDVKKDVDAALEPFRRVIRAKALDQSLVDEDLELLCNQAVRLVEGAHPDGKI